MKKVKKVNCHHHLSLENLNSLYNQALIDLSFGEVGVVWGHPFVEEGAGTENFWKRKQLH